MRRTVIARRMCTVLGLALALVGATTLLGAQRPAYAEVNLAVGMRGTVLGFSEWYGSYSFPGIGVAFCLDHGLASPDTDFGYRRMSPSPFTGERANRLAYLAYRYGATTDPVTAVAVKLVLHSEQQAQYPFGRLDVTSLTADQIAFGSVDAQIVERARAIHADLAHAYEGPYHLGVDLPVRMPADGQIRVNVLLTDAGARPLPGMRVTVSLTNTTRTTLQLTTDQRGRATSPLTVRNVFRAVTATARVTAPSPIPVVYEPTTTRAQRILMSGSLDVIGTDLTAASSVPPRPSPTPSPSPSLTSTPLPTATPSLPVPPTASPEVTTPTTASPEVTTPPTSTASPVGEATPTPISSSPPAPWSGPVPAAAAPVELPHTGSATLAKLGLGVTLICGGLILLLFGRVRDRPWPTATAW